MTWTQDPESTYALQNGRYRICRVKVGRKWLFELWIYGGDVAWDKFIARGTVQELQSMELSEVQIEARGPE